MAPHLIKTFDRQVNAHEVMAHLKVPKELAKVFEMNPKMKQRLVPAVLKGVIDSLQDPRTSPAVLTDSEMKRRCELSIMGLREIYFDRDCGLSLHRALDLLPEVLMNYLLEEGGHNIEEIAGEAREATDRPQSEERPGADARWAADVIERVDPAAEVEDKQSLPDLNEEIDAEDGKPDRTEFEAEEDRRSGRKPL